MSQPIYYVVGVLSFIVAGGVAGYYLGFESGYKSGYEDAREDAEYPNKDYDNY
jgi:hypothetical protein